MIEGSEARQISDSMKPASSSTSRSTGQPRICRCDAGTDRTCDPFDNVNNDADSSNTDPRSKGDAPANDVSDHYCPFHVPG